MLRHVCIGQDRSLPLYVDCIGHDWHQDLVYRPHGYPYVHWLQTDHGKGCIEVAGKKLILAEGQGILLNPAVPHKYYPLHSGWRTSYFAFGGALINEITRQLRFHNYLYISEATPAISRFIITNYNQLIDDTADGHEASSALVYQFLLSLKRYLRTTTDNSDNEKNIIVPIVHLIESKFAKPLTNNDFANLTHYSTQYIAAAFRAYYGITPHQYLMTIRVRKAKELLLNHDELTVEEVGKLVGFNTNSYFIAQFKAAEGSSPGEFRRYY